MLKPIQIYEQAKVNVTALLGPRPDPGLRIRFDTPDHEATNAQFRADIEAQLEAARKAASGMSYVGAKTAAGMHDIAVSLAHYDRWERAFAWDRAVKAECRRLEAEMVSA